MTVIRRCLSWSVFLLVSVTCPANASGGSLEKGVELFDEGDYARAKSIFERLQRESPEHPRINYYLGKSYIKERNYDSALKYLEKSLALDQSYPDAHYLQGIAYISLLNDVGIFKKLRYASKTKKAWQAALELNNNHLQSRFALASFYMNAPGIAGGDMDEAERQIDLLLDLHQGYGALATAIFLEKNDKILAAEEHFVSAVTKIDDRAGPLFNQANFYVRQERYSESLAKLEAYVASDQKSWDDPDDLFVHLLRANIMAGLNDHSSARVELEHALTLNPGDSIKKAILDRMDKL
jgi:tetratricopeptide (TPR) repeat protein